MTKEVRKRVDGEVFNARTRRRKVAKVLEMKLLGVFATWRRGDVATLRFSFLILRRGLTGELKVNGGEKFTYNPRHLPVAWAPGPCVIDDQRSQKKG
ncbi:hypothetical protein LF1_50190 [Rubripirellula obstinata]|uniref:Uncharacterized protein n=1 Tax=Rubripirellula obstinata TaxID=406547 RepID=A0A5B1CR62_9BACT|nr:hypothetical protein LF1_50190 [Rubripirellula obstinata]